MPPTTTVRPSRTNLAARTLIPAWVLCTVLPDPLLAPIRDIHVLATPRGCQHPTGDSEMPGLWTSDVPQADLEHRDIALFESSALAVLLGISYQGGPLFVIVIGRRQFQAPRANPRQPHRFLLRNHDPGLGIHRKLRCRAGSSVPQNTAGLPDGFVINRYRLPGHYDL